MSYARYVPRELRDLPFNSRRSQLYPENPPLAFQAMEMAQAGAPVPIAYMPQKVGFTRWKTPARTFADTALTSNAAVSGYQRQQAALSFTGRGAAPMYTTTQASADLVRLPQAAPEINPYPIARGVTSRMVPFEELDAYAQAASAGPPFVLPPAPAATNPVLSGLRGAQPAAVSWLGAAAVLGSVTASAFHGYRRSGGSAGAAIGWGLLGLVFPLITPAVALAQGFGQRK